MSCHGEHGIHGVVTLNSVANNSDEVAINSNWALPNLKSFR